LPLSQFVIEEMVMQEIGELSPTTVDVRRQIQFATRERA
jgi:hypothetical protein